MVADRRKHTLQTALKTFNRLQGIKLSKKGDLKLNLSQNPKAFSEQEIQSVEEQSSELYRLTNQDYEFLKAKGIEPASIEVEPGRVSLGSSVAREMRQYAAMHGYSVSDPKLINQTIDRYELLLNDKRSPIISNFMHLLDYQNGAGFESFESFVARNDGQHDLIEKFVI